MMCLSGRKVRVSNLVDHQNTWGGVATKPLPEQARVGSGVQCLGEVCQGGKQGGIPCSQSLHGKRQTQMRFPNTVRSQKNHVGSRLDKGEICQFPQQSF